MDSQPDFTEPSQKGVQMRLIGAIVFGVILIVLIFCIGIAVGRASKDSSSSNNDQSPSSPPPPPPHTNVPSNEFFLQKWGANDTDGALNYLTPEVVKHAISLVKTGKVYKLSMETNSKTPAYGARTYQPILQQTDAGQQLPFMSFEFPDGSVAENRYNEDIAYHYSGIGTHIDSFAHWTVDWQAYNGWHQNEILKGGIAVRLGVSDIKPIATRGLLLDMVKAKCGKEGVKCHVGVDGQKYLEGNTVITLDDIKSALGLQGINEIREGDVVLFHTGYNSILASETPTDYLASVPGVEEEGCEWLGSQGITAIGADTFSVDVFPTPPAGKTLFGCHPIFLARYGVHIIEYMETVELANDNVTEFLFVLGVPRYAGLVQANISPIAIV